MQWAQHKYKYTVPTPPKLCPNGKKASPLIPGLSLYWWHMHNPTDPQHHKTSDGDPPCDNSCKPLSLQINFLLRATCGIACWQHHLNDPLTSLPNNTNNPDLLVGQKRHCCHRATKASPLPAKHSKAQEIFIGAISALHFHGSQW